MLGIFSPAVSAMESERCRSASQSVRPRALNKTSERENTVQTTPSRASGSSEIEMVLDVVYDFYEERHQLAKAFVLTLVLLIVCMLFR